VIFVSEKRAIPEFVRKKERAKFPCLEMGPTIPDEYVALQYYSKSKQNKNKTIFKKCHFFYYNCIQLKPISRHGNFALSFFRTNSGIALFYFDHWNEIAYNILIT
jgi:hypothetical protein